MSQFGIITRQVLARKDVGNWAMRVFCTLATFADANRECFPKISTLCEMTGRDRSGIKEALRELRAAGLLETWITYRENGSVQGQRYRLNLTDRGIDPPPNSKRSPDEVGIGSLLGEGAVSTPGEGVNIPPTRRGSISPPPEQTSFNRPIEHNPPSPPTLFESPEQAKASPSRSGSNLEETVKGLWNEIMPASVPKVRTLQAKKARLKEADRILRKADTDWKAYFQRIAKSPKLTQKQPDFDWIVGIDYALSNKGLTKILNGDWDDPDAHKNSAMKDPRRGAGIDDDGDVLWLPKPVEESSFYTPDEDNQARKDDFDADEMLRDLRGEDDGGN